MSTFRLLPTGVRELRFLLLLCQNSSHLRPTPRWVTSPTPGLQTGPDVRRTVTPVGMT